MEGVKEVRERWRALTALKDEEASEKAYNKLLKKREIITERGKKIN